MGFSQFIIKNCWTHRCSTFFQNLSHNFIIGNAKKRHEYVYQLYADVNKFAVIADFFGCIQTEHSEIDYNFLGLFIE